MTAIPHAAWLKAKETQALIATLESVRAGGSRFVGVGRGVSPAIVL